MRVAITGASGFIGSALAESLRKGGHDVVAVSRRSGPNRVGWDPSAGSIDTEALGLLDAVVHLAGESIGGRWTQSKRDAILKSRVEGTRLIGGVVRQLGVPVFVSGSAIGVYGDRGDEQLTESSDPGDGFLAGVVQAWEHEAQEATGGATRLAMIRTGLVMDPSGGTLPRMLRLFKLGGGGKLGSGDQWWSWITLRDQVRAIEHILSRDDIAGPVNLTAPKPVTNAVFTEVLADSLSRPAILPAPAFALRAVLGGDFADELLLASQRVLPGVLESTGFEFEHPTLEEAFAAIL